MVADVATNAVGQRRTSGADRPANAVAGPYHALFAVDAAAIVAVAAVGGGAVVVAVEIAVPFVAGDEVETGRDDEPEAERNRVPDEVGSLVPAWSRSGNCFRFRHSRFQGHPLHRH